MQIRSLGATSNGNCHYVAMNGTEFLLDAGLAFAAIQKGIGFRTHSMAGVLLTHAHVDHSKAIKDMLKAGIEVYASRGTLNQLGINHYRAHIVKAGEWFTMGGLRVLPIETVHDTAEPLGFVIDGEGERLLYLTDSLYNKYDIHGITHMIVECNHSLDILRESDVNESLKHRIMKNHMSLETVEKMIESMDKSRLQHVYLTHLSDKHSDEAMFRERIQRLTGVEVDVF